MTKFTAIALLVFAFEIFTVNVAELPWFTLEGAAERLIDPLALVLPVRLTIARTPGSEGSGPSAGRLAERDSQAQVRFRVRNAKRSLKRSEGERDRMDCGMIAGKAINLQSQ